MDFLADLDRASDRRKANLCRTWQNSEENDCGVLVFNRHDFVAKDGKKAYHGKRLNEWWCDYAKADGHFTIAQLKDFEGVGHRMKGMNGRNQWHKN